MQTEPPTSWDDGAESPPSDGSSVGSAVRKRRKRWSTDAALAEAVREYDALRDAGGIVPPMRRFAEERGVPESVFQRYACPDKSKRLYARRAETSAELVKTAAALGDDVMRRAAEAGHSGYERGRRRKRRWAHDAALAAAVWEWDACVARGHVADGRAVSPRSSAASSTMGRGVYGAVTMAEFAAERGISSSVFQRYACNDKSKRMVVKTDRTMTSEEGGEAKKKVRRRWNSDPSLARAVEEYDAKRAKYGPRGVVSMDRFAAKRGIPSSVFQRYACADLSKRMLVRLEGTTESSETALKARAWSSNSEEEGKSQRKRKAASPAGSAEKYQTAETESVHSLQEEKSLRKTTTATPLAASPAGNAKKPRKKWRVDETLARAVEEYDAIRDAIDAPSMAAFAKERGIPKSTFQRYACPDLWSRLLVQDPPKVEEKARPTRKKWNKDVGLARAVREFDATRGARDAPTMAEFAEEKGIPYSVFQRYACADLSRRALVRAQEEWETDVARGLGDAPAEYAQRHAFPDHSSRLEVENPPMEKAGLPAQERWDADEALARALREYDLTRGAKDAPTMAEFAGWLGIPRSVFQRHVRAREERETAGATSAATR